MAAADDVYTPLQPKLVVVIPPRPKLGSRSPGAACPRPAGPTVAAIITAAASRHDLLPIPTPRIRGTRRDPGCPPASPRRGGCREKAGGRGHVVGTGPASAIDPARGTGHRRGPMTLNELLATPGVTSAQVQAHLASLSGEERVRQATTLDR